MEKQSTRRWTQRLTAEIFNNSLHKFRFISADENWTFSLPRINNLAYVVGLAGIKETLRCLITKREINIVNQTKWIYALFGHKS